MKRFAKVLNILIFLPTKLMFNSTGCFMRYQDTLVPIICIYCYYLKYKLIENLYTFIC